MAILSRPLSRVSGRRPWFLGTPQTCRRVLNNPSRHSLSGLATQCGRRGAVSTPSPRAAPGIAVHAMMPISASYSTRTDSSPAVSPKIHPLFEKTTGTWQYIVADPSSSNAAIIDPVLDFDPATQRLSTDAADALLRLVDEQGYTVQWILETHAHADHLTAAAYLKKRLAQTQPDRKPIVGIGKRIDGVQSLFGQRYRIHAEEYIAVFDKLFDDDETFSIGGMTATAIHLPGHTPDHLGYKIGDNVFCGDSIFNSDIGTARCDFPGGNAASLWSSCLRLLSMPEQVKIWTGHDYPPDGREDPIPFMTVKEHRMNNKHLQDGVTEEAFVVLRKERDEKLAAPRLIHQSLQVNIRAGKLPTPTQAGQRLLHVPLKIGDNEW